MEACLTHVPELQVEDGQGFCQVVHSSCRLPSPLYRGCHHGAPLQDSMNIGSLRCKSSSAAHCLAHSCYLLGPWEHAKLGTSQSS